MIAPWVFTSENMNRLCCPVGTVLRPIMDDPPIAAPAGARYGDHVRELDVVGVRVEMPSNNPIVLLRERDGDRYLPIWVAGPEASAIAFAQNGVVTFG